MHILNMAIPEKLKVDPRMLPSSKVVRSWLRKQFLSTAMVGLVPAALTGILALMLLTVNHNLCLGLIFGTMSIAALAIIASSSIGVSASNRKIEEDSALWLKQKHLFYYDDLGSKMPLAVGYCDDEEFHEIFSNATRFLFDTKGPRSLGLEGLKTRLAKMAALNFGGTLGEAFEIASDDAEFMIWLQREGSHLDSALKTPSNKSQTATAHILIATLKTKFNNALELARGLSVACPESLSNEVKLALDTFEAETSTLWSHYESATRTEDEAVWSVFENSINAKLEELSSLNRSLAEILVQNKPERLENAREAAESLKKGYEEVKVLSEPLRN